MNDASLPSVRSWPVDAWYVAAATDEVAAKPFGRRICGERMVFFRCSDGSAAALEDFCPHRGAPLSLGFARDGMLVCGYHGLAVKPCGQAESMPGQPIRVFPTTRSFPIVERYGFIWVWPGDPGKADPAQLPRLHWAESDEWAYGGGRYHIKCDYRLMIDNLMDLTHETYVHATSIGQKEIDEAAVTTSVGDGAVVTSRVMEKISAPPFWRMALRGAGLPEDIAVDRWQICRFTPPSHVMIEVGVALAGNGGHKAPAAQKACGVVVDFITPETETSHHYFWGMARQFAIDDEALTASIREGQGKIFAEDLEMLEMQQQNILAYPDRRLMRLNIDAGGVRSRQMIGRAIAAERGG